MKFLETCSMMVGDLLPSDERDARLLASATAETVTVPSNAKWARLVANNDLWVDELRTAVKPAADITDKTSAWFLPARSVRLVNVFGTASFSVVSDAVAVLVIEWFN